MTAVTYDDGELMGYLDGPIFSGDDEGFTVEGESDYWDLVTEGKINYDESFEIAKLYDGIEFDNTDDYYED